MTLHDVKKNLGQESKTHKGEFSVNKDNTTYFWETKGLEIYATKTEIKHIYI